MWLIFQLRKEFKKISDSFNKFKSAITELTSQSLNNRILIEKNKEDIVSKKEIDLMIREALLKVQSVPNYELKSEPNKEKHFEGIMIKKAIKNRPEFIKQAIRGLIERDLRTTDIFNIVVNEKKIVGKTQFYHYLSIVRTELRSGLRPELQTKHNKQTNEN